MCSAAWEIAENLHRAELSDAEWRQHIAEWVRLTVERIEQDAADGVSVHGGPKLSTRGRIGHVGCHGLPDRRRWLAEPRRSASLREPSDVRPEMTRTVRQAAELHRLNNACEQ
jgi:hypothetical protein